MESTAAVGHPDKMPALCHDPGVSPSPGKLGGTCHITLLRQVAEHVCASVSRHCTPVQQTQLYWTFTER